MANEVVEVSASQNDEENLRSIATNIKNYVSDNDAETMNLVISKLKDKPSIVARLFPSAYEQEMQSLNITKIRQLFSNEESLVKAHAAIHLELVRIQGNAMLAGAGINAQQQLTVYVKEKIDQIEVSISESQHNILSRLRNDKERAKIDFADDDEILQASLKSTSKRIMIHMEMNEELIAGAKRALTEKIKHI
ncbi:MAG: hypothetical protein PHQ35_10890 [Phycisphaerae bacterium]|nr:hypothetical protein [Phycisphaerae bacterium]